MSDPLAVGVLVSGAGTNLQALLDTVHGREAQVVAVAASAREVPALARAKAVGVPGRAFPLEEFPSRAARDEAIAAWLGQAGVALVVLAGYMQLLGSAFLGRFPGAVINVHPSLLPAFPGLGAIEQALEHGARVTGATVHFVDGGIDTGPIILQRAVDIDAGMSPEDLHDRLRPVEHELLPEAVRLYAAGRLRDDQANPRRAALAASDPDCGRRST